MTTFNFTAFQRPGEPWILHDEHGKHHTNLTELWLSASDEESIAHAIDKAEFITYVLIVNLFQRFVGPAAELEEYNCLERDILAGLSLLRHLARFKALPLVPGKVQELHAPVMDVPRACEDCGTVYEPPFCQECGTSWPCETLKASAPLRTDPL